MELPKITAIIPVYNHEKWVETSIRKMAASKYPHKRLVIIDDGSTDYSHSVIMGLMKNSKKVNLPSNDEPKSIYAGLIDGINALVISFNKPYGPSSARNYGIKTGWDGTDLFACCDSDDWYHEDKLMKSAQIWTEYPSVIGLMYSDFTTVNGVTGYESRQFKEAFSRDRLMQECIINCDSLFSKQALEKVGLFDETLRTCEDYDLYLRIIENFVAIHIPENLLYIRVGNHSSTNNVTKEHWEQNYRRVFEKLKQRMSSNS